MAVRIRIVVPEFSALITFSGGFRAFTPVICRAFLSCVISAPNARQPSRVAIVSLASRAFEIVEPCLEDASDAMAIARCV